MKETIDFKSKITVDDNQLVTLKVEVKNLTEEWIKEYFLAPESKIQKHMSDVLLRCLKNISASEALNNEELDL